MRVQQDSVNRNKRSENSVYTIEIHKGSPIEKAKLHKYENVSEQME